MLLNVSSQIQLDMKTITLNPITKADKDLKELLLGDLKAFKNGKGKFLPNNSNRQGTTLQIA